MIWHSLVWAFWAAAAAGSLLYGTAAWRALDVAANWQPATVDQGQLQRERNAELAGLLARGAMVCLSAAALMGLIGIALSWHRIIPGAMCGTGVLQAMGIAGPRAMLFWWATIALLFGWTVMDGLDRRHPRGVAVPVCARLLVTAAPFLVLALVYSWQSLMRIDSTPPVSCCAAVYDRILGNASESRIMAALPPAVLWGSLIGSIILPIAALTSSRSSRPGPERRAGTPVFALATLWCVLAATAVKTVWSSYYYEVLSHPCPWCLFLADHHGVGFFIFACLAVVSLEAVAFWAADHTRHRYPVLAEPAGRRRRTAARRIAAGIIAFTLLTVGPALVWRLRTGAWINGS